MSLDVGACIRESYAFELDHSKVRLPRRMELSLYDTDIYLGDFLLFSSNEDKCREEFRRIKSLLEGGNYRILLRSSLRPQIDEKNG